MAQNYYSKHYVNKLRARAECAEENFKSTLDDNEKLGIELKEAKEYGARYAENYRNEQAKRSDLEQQIKVLRGEATGRDTTMAMVKRGAVRRAHEELHKVKPTERNTDLLQRAVGNAQGILAAALDANNDHASPLSLYPDEDKAQCEVSTFGPSRGWR